MKNERKCHSFLSTTDYSRAIFDAWKNSAKTIHFSGGGEPLMHPKTKRMLATAKSLGLETALSTNGVFLDNETISFVDNPRISLNAATKETYRKITGTNYFNTVVENIKNIPVGHKKKTGVAFLVIPDNMHEIEQFCSLANDLKVGWVHIRPAYLSDKGQNKTLIDSSGLMADKLSKIEKKFPNLDIFYRVDKFDGFWNDNKYDCKCTSILAVLKASGKFCVCQDRTDLEFGDYKNQSFESIWGKKEHLDALEKVRNCNIRCVETKKNEIIQRVFINDELKRNVI